MALWTRAMSGAKIIRITDKSTSLESSFFFSDVQSPEYQSLCTRNFAESAVSASASGDAEDFFVIALTPQATAAQRHRRAGSTHG